MANRDRTSEQLNDFKKAQGDADRMTNSTGSLIGNKLASMTAGPRGPMLIQDFVYTDEMAHFNRERIPERVVHAKGGGAFGYLEITHDITQYCKAAIFSQVGKKTPLLVRFSTVGGESGSADTARDPRGFAVKFYTEEGNWDLTGNNTPIFFIRDPILFPSFIHTQKRNPKTHMKDPDMFWDFISLRPETTHQVSFLFSDRGTPDGFRHMNGYGSHTFKMVNAQNEAVYCKFHFKTDQGIKNLMADQANELAGSDPDYALRDLYNAIDTNNFPSWTLHIQVMTFEQAENFRWNPFDLTKIWPQGEFPLIPVGRMVLNRNPKNYFAEIEQSAFSPSHMVPGIEPSPDKMLQGRLFSYPDTHRHRLGTNYLQIPVNCPFNTRVRSYQRDGPQCVTDNQEGAPNYYPNSFNGPKDDTKYLEHVQSFTGDVQRYNTEDDDNYTQVGTFWNKVLSPEERQRLVTNIGGHLVNAQEFLQKRTISNFSKADPAFGRGIQEVIDGLNAAKSVKKIAAHEIIQEKSASAETEKVIEAVSTEVKVVEVAKAVEEVKVTEKVEQIVEEVKATSDEVKVNEEKGALIAAAAAEPATAAQVVEVKAVVEKVETAAAVAAVEKEVVKEEVKQEVVKDVMQAEVVKTGAVKEVVKEEIAKEVVKEAVKVEESITNKAVEKEVAKTVEKEVAKTVEKEVTKTVEKEVVKTAEKEAAKEVKAGLKKIVNGKGAQNGGLVRQALSGPQYPGLEEDVDKDTAYSTVKMLKRGNVRNRIKLFEN